MTALVACVLALAPARADAQARPPETGVRADAPGELAGFPLAEYRARRSRVREVFAGGVLVVRGASADEVPENAEFRQGTWFLYLTGVRTPGALLVIDATPGATSRETLYLPPRSPESERWTGPQIGADSAAAAGLGFDRVAETTEFDRDLRAIFGRSVLPTEHVTVWTVAPSGAEAALSRDAAFASQLRGLTKAMVPGRMDVADATPRLADVRRTKSAAEVDKLRSAIAITLDAQRAAARDIAPGRFEYEVEGTIVGAFLRGGAEREGFPSIVGSGRNSTVLHYERNESRIEAGDLVVVDIGAELHGYTADVTRTWPASGTFTKRQREVYELVLEAQSAAAAAWRPGMSMRGLTEAAVAAMQRSPLRDRSGKTLDVWFLHGLGHFLGMDVHDVGDYTVPLRPGDVITIEPGIYLADEGFGVRIEDDYLVTEKGLVKLSGGLPSAPDDIERLMRRR